MWSNEDSFQLISTIENHILTTIPITSINNNHEFTGNLLDVPGDWNAIAIKVNRNGKKYNIFLETFLDM